MATGPVVLLAGAITVLGWPIANGPAGGDLDRSWQAGLHMAAALSLRQGVDIVFTYGPLGFLTVPHPVFGATTVLALLATGAVYVGLLATLLIEARRLMPLWASAIVTLLVARLFFALPPPEAFEALLFLWAAEALFGRLPLPSRPIVIGAGALASVASMVKFDVGVVALIMGASVAVTVSVRWWRSLAGYFAAVVATTAAIWLLTGQQLTDLVPFAVGAYNLVAGFSESMGTDHAASAWAVPAVLLTVGLLSWLGFGAHPYAAPRRRVAVAVVWATYAFATWKIAAVREHPYAFPMLAVALFPLTTSGHTQHLAGADRRTWLMSLALLLIASAASSPFTIGRYVDMRSSIRSVAREIKDILPGRLDTTAQRTRMQLGDRYDIPPQLLAELTGRTVHIDPYDASIAFAFPEVRWRPLPVFQSYTAYTPYLDDLNAARLRSADAPERILRLVRLLTDPADWERRQRGKPLPPGDQIPFAIDGRFWWFESPAAMLETFCRYTQLDATDRWQVLDRTSTSCGAPEALGTVVARAGETVTVPAEPRPDRFVIVRIHGLEPGLADHVVSALYQASEWFVTVGDGVRYRLVAATAADGLLLAVPPAADGTGAFAFGPPIRTIAVQAGIDGHGSSRSISYEFQSVPLQR